MLLSKFIIELIPHSRQQWLYFCLMLFSLLSLFGFSSTSLGKIFKYSDGIILWIIILTSPKRWPRNLNSNFLLLLLLIWTIFITIGSFTYNIEMTEDMLESQYYRVLVARNFVPHIFPLYVFLTTKYENDIDIRYILKIAIFCAIIFLVIYPFAFNNMINYQWTGDIIDTEEGEEGNYWDFITNSTYQIANVSCPTIVLFLYKYIPKTYYKLFISTYMMGLILSVYTARRGDVAIALITLVSVWLLYSFVERKLSKTKMILVIVFSLFLGYMFLSNINSLLVNITARGLEDTRSAIIENFWRDMQDDAWLGRGWFGMYYDASYLKYRMSVEAGYLALILRGGIVYLLLYVTFLIKSAYLGFFKSSNLFVKSLAITIVIHVISLIPFGWPSINLKYLLVWVSAYVCSSARYRHLKESEIYRVFFNRE